MANMSFMLTEPQILARTKTVTRRLGWLKLKVGDELVAIYKGMGLKSGEKVRQLARIRVVSVRREPFRLMRAEPYGSAEANMEGFPDMSGSEFVAMFACDDLTEVTRIEFEYLD